MLIARSISRPSVPRRPLANAVPSGATNTVEFESVTLSGSAPSGRGLSLSTLSTLSEQTALETSTAAIGGSFSLLGGLKRLGGLVRDLATGELSARWAAQAKVAEINELEPQFEGLSDAQLKAKTTEFRARLAEGESLDDLMSEAYATVREATRRETGLRLYDEQLEGGIYAHQGHVVEMKTGEGKTLMGLLPTYLNALTGDGVHVMTFNDYLAERDARKADSVFTRLGVSVGVIQEDMDDESRVIANQADILYGSASEFGFQYLNDNLALNRSDRVSRDLSKVFTLLDEADSLLLDESRTPLLIADSHREDIKPIQVFSELVRHLVDGQDYEVELDKRVVTLTESGQERVQKILGVGSLYEGENRELLPYLQSALQARTLFHKDEHYIVREGDVLLIDEFTGRAKEDHHFSEGLHQAIEAKEGLEIGDTQETLASVTYPNFLRKYSKVSGMTGTAVSARAEFEDLGLEVRLVKTHRPTIRKDREDLIFETKEQRNQALATQVRKLHAQGRPVLIGTRSIESSEALSLELTRQGIPHNLLNARQPDREANVVAQAGRQGAVTIATNMAGRGTDIKLGGDPRELAAAEASEKGGAPADYIQKWEAIAATERQHVLAHGGLFVLGTERHESRRIDEQLIGRAGRQGDPGESQFLISAEDDLFVRHLSKMPDKLDAKAMVKKAQEVSEGRNLAARRHLLKYDGVRNLQREALYSERDALLNGASIVDALPGLVERAARNVLSAHSVGDRVESSGALQGHITALLRNPKIPNFANRTQMENWLVKELNKMVEEKRASIGDKGLSIGLGRLYLQMLDDGWSHQQEELDRLRDGAWMHSFAQREPIVEYSLSAYQAYERMLDGISENLITSLSHIKAHKS